MKNRREIMGGRPEADFSEAELWAHWKNAFQRYDRQQIDARYRAIDQALNEMTTERKKRVIETRVKINRENTEPLRPGHDGVLEAWETAILRVEKEDEERDKQPGPLSTSLFSKSFQEEMLKKPIVRFLETKEGDGDQ